MLHPLLRFVRWAGVLRAMLVAGAACLTAMAPFAFGPVAYSGWPLVATILAPALFVLLAFVIPLDMLMTRVYMSGADGDAHARLRRILWMEFAVEGVMVAAWTPFLVDLTTVG